MNQELVPGDNQLRHRADICRIGSRATAAVDCHAGGYESKIVIAAGVEGGFQRFGRSPARVVSGLVDPIKDIGDVVDRGSRRHACRR